MSPKNRKVVVVVYDGLCTFEFGVAVEVFGLPRPEIGRWYEFSLCTAEEDKNSLRAVGGFRLAVNKGLGALRSAGTIIVPGWRDVNERPPEALLSALRRSYARGARLMSLCSGAFVLAATGLLDGRRAATHWRYVEQLSRDYPSIDVNPNVLYVEDHRSLTAAGSAAGIDLCLQVVRKDYGANIANIVARRLVVPPHRDGGQAQYIDHPVSDTGESEIGSLMDWVRRNLNREHTVASMAKRAKLSERTLARRFHEQAGTTPMRWLAKERIAKAQALLETTKLGIEQVAAKCGFGSAQLLRFHFQRIASTSPTTYRKQFRRTP